MSHVEIEPDRTAARIRDFLRNNDSMLKGERETYVDHPLGGHCYVASEAYYHLLNDREAWRPESIAVEWDKNGIHGSMTHWFLRHDSGKVVDLTAEQFDVLPVTPMYEGGVGRGFVPPSPSNRAQETMAAVEQVKEAVKTHEHGQALP